ncbi:hypothetical protein IFM12275_15520 [Nocardia sputorum]|nr:hypothetical protein IFM12275_15520 [Nocardia sputorum]
MRIVKNRLNLSPIVRDTPTGSRDAGNTGEAPSPDLAYLVIVTTASPGLSNRLVPYLDLLLRLRAATETKVTIRWPFGTCTGPWTPPRPEDVGPGVRGQDASHVSAGARSS